MLRLVVSAFLIASSFFGLSQKGAIIETGDYVLDPDSNRYVSETVAGFSDDGYDVDEFEFRMFGVPIFGDGEVLNDTDAGEPCGVTDLALDSAGYAIYARYDDSGNLIFRFRLAGNRPSVEAYTILIDTDNLIGEDDPNSNSENPGFEIDITLIQRMGVYVFDIDGADKCSAPILEYDVATHQQKSIGGLESCGDEDYYIDFYVPFGDITALTGVTATTDLRLAGLTNVSATCAIDGKISDIAGVDDTNYNGCFSCAILDLVENQCPFLVDSLCNDCEGFPIGPTDPPVINKPVLEGASTVSGTSDPEAAIYLELYGSDNILVDQDTVLADLQGDWITNTLERPLNLGDSIVVNALAAGRCASGLSIIGSNFALVAENDQPVIIGSKTSLGYFENQGNQLIDDLVEITDDETTLDSAWVIIDAGFNSNEDSLTYVDDPLFEYEYSGPGYLKLKGDLPLTSYVEQLRQIGYINESEDPDNSLRTIQFRVSDGVNTSQPYTYNLIVSPVNDPPVIVDPGDNSVIDTLRFTINEDSILALCFDAYDLELDDLALDFVQLPSSGIAVALDTGTNCYLYTPNLNYNGDDEFIVEVCDNGNPVECTRLVVQIAILPVNDPPVIKVNGTLSDTLRISTKEDTPVEICFTATDVEGDPVALNPPGGSENGNLSIAVNDLCLNISPATGFLGEDSLILPICDNGTPSLCDTIVIIVNVLEVNLNPEIVSGGSPVDTLDFTTKANQPIDLCIEAADPNDDDIFTGDITLLEGQGSLTALDSSVSVGGNIARCLNFMPGTDFVGETLFKVLMCDSGNPQLCDSVIVRIDVEPNVPPVFTEPGTTLEIDTLQFTINEDSTLAFCFGLFDEEGNTISLDLITAPQNGLLNPLDTGTNCYLYKPNLNYFGDDEIVFEACDDGFPEGCATLVVEIEILPVNDPPVIEFNGIFSDTLRISTEEDTPVQICFTATDVEGDPVTLDPPAGSENGDLTISINDLCLNITPDTGFLGEDAVVVPICDSGIPSLCDTIVVIVNVIDINRAPTILSNGQEVDTLHYVTRANQPIDICIETTDPDNDDVILGNVTVIEGQGDLSATGNTLDVNGNVARCFEFSPGQDFIGETILDVSICDTGNPQLCDNVFVKVEVLPNTPPVFIEPGAVTVVDTIFVTVNEDDVSEFCFDIFDAENDNVSVVETTSPTNGFVSSLSTGSNCYSYEPAPDYYGQDLVIFESCDDGFPQGCNTLVVEIDVLPVNDPPQILFNGQPVDTLFYSTDMDVPIDLCIELTDIDNNELSVSEISVISGMGALTAIDSTLSINGHPAECLLFEPGIGFVGNAYYNVDICDNGNPALCDQVVVAIEVSPVPAAVNNPPEFYINGTLVGDVRFTINEGTQLDTCVTVLDTDGDNLTLQSFEVETEAGILEASLLTDLCFTYTPPDGYYGEAAATFTVCDDGDPQLCGTLMVTIEVLPVNLPPEANDDTVYLSMNEQIILNPLNNDFDPEDEGLFLTQITSGPSSGDVSILSDSTLQYTPTPDYYGEDAFEYQVCDLGIPEQCDVATVYVLVEGEPQLPFKIFEGISPNGDGVNDVWILQGIENYPNNFVRVYDQWNNLIYEVRGYNNDDRAWRGNSTNGLSNGSVGNGTYMYVINLGDGSSPYSGTVVLKK